MPLILQRVPASKKKRPHHPAHEASTTSSSPTPPILPSVRRESLPLSQLLLVNGRDWPTRSSSLVAVPPLPELSSPPSYPPIGVGVDLASLFAPNNGGRSEEPELKRFASLKRAVTRKKDRRTKVRIEGYPGELSFADEDENVSRRQASLDSAASVPPRHPPSPSSLSSSHSVSRLRRFLSLRGTRQKHEESAASLRRAKTTAERRVPTMVFSPFVASFEETPAAGYLRRQSSVPVLSTYGDGRSLLLRIDEFDGTAATASVDDLRLSRPRSRSEAPKQSSDGILLVAPPFRRMPPYPPSSRFIEDLPPSPSPHPAPRIRFVLPQRPLPDSPVPSSRSVPSLATSLSTRDSTSSGSDSDGSDASSLELQIPLYSSSTLEAPLRSPVTDFPQPPDRHDAHDSVGSALLVHVDQVGVRRNASLIRSSSLRSNGRKVARETESFMDMQ